jgi:hypothetical protein
VLADREGEEKDEVIPSSLAKDTFVDPVSCECGLDGFSAGPQANNKTPMLAYSVDHKGHKGHKPRRLIISNALA